MSKTVPQLVSVVCTYCEAAHLDAEFQADDLFALFARELGDGSICVQCPNCERSLAVFEAFPAPEETTR